MITTCDELKVVVHEACDLAFAEAMASLSNQGRNDDQAAPELLLQPSWQSAAGPQLAIGYVRSHPKRRLSLQTHKWLGVR